MSKPIEAVEAKFKAIQLKYHTLTNTSDPFYANDPVSSNAYTLIQFTARKLRSSAIIEDSTEKTDAIQSAMLEYILDKYGKNGKNILSAREENLLTAYIEAYVLKQTVTDPKGDLHTILQIVREAGETVTAASSPEPHPARRCY